MKTYVRSDIRVPKSNTEIMKKPNYEAPMLEILDVAVERGFAVSTDFEEAGEDQGTWE